MIGTVLSFAALGFSLTIPGYFATLGLFPKKGELSGIERFTLSFVFSIALVPLLLVLENIVLSIPINYFSVSGTLAVVIIAGALVWFLRSKQLLENAVPLIPETATKLFGKH